MKAALVGPELEENLALRYIHASTVSAGHHAQIFDFHDGRQIPGLISQVIGYRPDAVGLSMVFTARAREYVRLAESLRAAGYKGHITAGGHFACLHAERLLADVPAIDSVLHGEGEHAVRDLLTHLRSVHEVAGITYRARSGELVQTAPRPPLNALDDLPFPTRPAEFHRYFGRPIANILSGRGCFANCDFCSINAWHRVTGGKRFRQRSVENLATEMAQLYHRRGIRIFNFHDDNFFLPTEQQNVERFSAIRRSLAERGVGRIAVQVKARPDTVELESMEILKAIGLFRVFLGVESNSVAGLKALGRGISRERNHLALRLLKDIDVHVTFNLLMFEPECTIADLRENIRFIQEQADVPLNFCRTEVYGGTALEARLRAAGRLEGDYFGYNYTMTDPRSQLAYELFRDVFTPRNFHYDGMNLQAMTLDYHLHLLRHFHASAGGTALRSAVKSFIRDLNANNAELLTGICDAAESAKPDRRALSLELSTERVAFDEMMRPRCRSLLREMDLLAKAASGRPRTRRYASTAAAAVLATVLNTHCTEMAPHATEMAAQQTDPPSDPPRTYPTEMAPEPPSQTRPAGGSSPREGTSRPAGSQPASQPATPKLPKAEAAKVEKALSSRDIRRQVGRICGKHGITLKTIEVDIQIGRLGRVVKSDIQLPKDLPKTKSKEFRKELEEAIMNWRFPSVQSNGTCKVQLRPEDPGVQQPKSPREVHMFEMAPRDPTPPPPKQNPPEVK